MSGSGPSTARASTSSSIAEQQFPLDEVRDDGSDLGHAERQVVAFGESFDKTFHPDRRLAQTIDSGLCTGQGATPLRGARPGIEDRDFVTAIGHRQDGFQTARQVRRPPLSLATQQRLNAWTVDLPGLELACRIGILKIIGQLADGLLVLGVNGSIAIEGDDVDAMAFGIALIGTEAVIADRLDPLDRLEMEDQRQPGRGLHVPGIVLAAENRPVDARSGRSRIRRHT